MTLSISMWNIQGFNSTAFGLKSLNTEFQKSIKEMDIIILQETWSRADAHPTQLQRNHPTITKTQHSPTGKRLRRTNNLVQIKFHNHINTVKQGKYYTWLKICSHPENIYSCVPYTSRHQSPLLQRRHFLHIRGRDEPLPGPGKRAHLRGPERKNRTTAGLHRHTREQKYQQQTDCY